MRVFEADTKGQFDRLVNKYKIRYDQYAYLYSFDKEFFRNNKVYIVHNNSYGADTKILSYSVINENDIIHITFFTAIPSLQTDNIKEGYHGDLIVVSKEFAKDAKKVVVEYN
jgi:hypothetical protein